MEIGNAFVTIGANLAPLMSGLRKGKSALASMGNALAGLAGMGSLLGVGLAAGAGLAAVGLIKMGSTLEEQNSKFDTLFQGQAAKVREWSKAFAEGAGRSAVECQGLAADMQGLLGPMGFTGQAGALMSTQFVQLANDLASFDNRITTVEALDKIRSGITGETEPLKSLGIIINEVTMNEKLRELGIAKSIHTATEQQKAIARSAIIFEKAGLALNDSTRTSASLANQWRGLTGAAYDLGTYLGTLLVPGATAVVSSFKSMLDWVNKSKEGFFAWGSGIVSAVGGKFAFLGAIWQRVTGAIMTAWGVVGPYVLGAWDMVTSGISSAFSMATDLIATGVGYIADGFASLIEWGAQIIGTMDQFGFGGGQAMETLGGWVDYLWEKFMQFGEFIGGYALQAWNNYKSFVVAAFTTVKTWIENAIFLFMNLDLTVKTAGLVISQTFANAVIRVQTFVANAVTLFQWFGANWRDILFTAGDYVLTILSNLGTNIRALWQGVLDFIDGKGFNVDFTGLTEGAKSAISKMPQMKDFIGTKDFDSAFDEIGNEWQKRADDWNKTMAENAPKIGQTLADGVNGGIKKIDPRLKTGIDNKTLAKMNKGGTAKKTSDKAGEKKDLTGAFDEIQKAALQGGMSPAQEQVRVSKEILKTQYEQIGILKKKNYEQAKAVLGK